MGSVARAIQALEIALREVGHPLTNARPGGRDRSDLLDQAGHILGAPLPNELVELWEWWGGREFWPPEREPPGVWEDVLPGGVTILSLEEAKTQLDFFLEIWNRAQNLPAFGFKSIGGGCSCLPIVDLGRVDASVPA